MIPKPEGNKLAAIGRCEVQTVWLCSIPKFLFLQFHYCANGLSHGISHLLDCVLLFPALAPLPICKVRDVECSKVLRVCRPMNIRINVIIHQVHHVTTDVDEVRNDSIVHEGVSTEDERMIVDHCHWCGSSSTNVREDGLTSRIRANASKAGVVERGLSVLIERRVLCRHTVAVEFFCGCGIPSDPESINIEEAITCCDLMLCCDVIGVVRK